MFVALTNDDGVSAAGLAAMHGAVERWGMPHAVFADRAGLSNLGTALRVADGVATLESREGCVWTFRDSTPGLMAVAACSAVAGTPASLLLSGVNDGPNVGAIHVHSGTVGAAAAAAGLGVPAIAVSSDDVYSTGGIEGGRRHFGSAAAVAVLAARAVLALGYQGMLSINVPNRPLEHLASAAAARPARVRPFARLDGDRRLTVAPDCSGTAEGDEVDLLSEGLVTVCAPWTVNPGSVPAAVAREVARALAGGESERYAPDRP